MSIFDRIGGESPVESLPHLVADIVFGAAALAFSFAGFISDHFSSAVSGGTAIGVFVLVWGRVYFLFRKKKPPQ